MLTLQHAELREFTGRARRSDQEAWLDTHWRELLIGPDMQVKSRRPMHSIPMSDTGIYFLWHKDEWLLYVGMTNTPHQRFTAHLKRGLLFEDYGFLPVRYEHCPAVEKAYIYALTPPANRKYEQPRWEGHGEMVKAIKELWC